MDTLSAVPLPALRAMRAALDAAISARERPRDGRPTPNETRRAALALVQRAVPSWQCAAPGSGFDVMTQGGERLLVKGRCLTKDPAYSTFADIVAYADRPFDGMVGLVFDQRLRLQSALKIPRTVMERAGEALDNGDLVVPVTADWAAHGGVIDLTKVFARHDSAR
ncbi:MAG: hypothetical protein AAF318_18700 [Pseudomonadota bacterium]